MLNFTCTEPCFQMNSKDTGLYHYVRSGIVRGGVLLNCKCNGPCCKRDTKRSSCVLLLRILQKRASLHLKNWLFLIPKWTRNLLEIYFIWCVPLCFPPSSWPLAWTRIYFEPSRTSSFLLGGCDSFVGTVGFSLDMIMWSWLLGLYPYFKCIIDLG